MELVGREDYKTQREFLQTLCNSLGDFKVARARLDPDGTPRCPPHRSVLDCWHSDDGLRFLDTVNNRQILPCEIIIDIDESPSITKAMLVIDRLNTHGIRWKLYATGSRGYHLHVWIKDLLLLTPDERTIIRLKLLRNIGAGLDLQKTTERVMIALEGAPHWKTG